MQDPSITCMHIYICNASRRSSVFSISTYLPIYLSTYLPIYVYASMTFYDPIMPQRSSTRSTRSTKGLKLHQLLADLLRVGHLQEVLQRLPCLGGWVQWIRCWKRNGTPSEGISCNQKMGKKGHVLRYGAPQFANETERKNSGNMSSAIGAC